MLAPHGKFIAVIHAEGARDIQRQVVVLPLCLQRFTRCETEYERQRTKFDVALDTEMLHGQMVFSIVDRDLKMDASSSFLTSSDFRIHC